MNAIKLISLTLICLAFSGCGHKLREQDTRVYNLVNDPAFRELLTKYNVKLVDPNPTYDCSTRQGYYLYEVKLMTK